VAILSYRYSIWVLANGKASTIGANCGGRIRPLFYRFENYFSSTGQIPVVVADIPAQIAMQLGILSEITKSPGELAPL